MTDQDDVRQQLITKYREAIAEATGLILDVLVATTDCRGEATEGLHTLYSEMLCDLAKRYEAPGHLH